MFLTPNYKQRAITDKIRKANMGMIRAEIELVNGMDATMARKQMIGEDKVRSIRVEMIVDTGSFYMCINESIQEYLQIPVMGTRKGELADGRRLDLPLVGPLEVRFKDRLCFVEAMVLPGDSESLLGAIPLEAMDIFIDPKRQELVTGLE